MMTPTLSFKANPALNQFKPQAGFTLLEILLVLTIIGMASILVVPNITSLESRTFDAQIRQANSLLNYARRMAVVKGQPTVASFIISAGESSAEQTVENENTDSQRSTPIGEWFSEGLQLSYRDSADRKVEIDERIDITFYPEGGSTGGTLLISLAEASIGEPFAIEIDPFTGRITMISPDN